MKASLTRLLLTPVLAIAFLTICSSASAQGTANGPNTTHTVGPGPGVLIGNPNNPFPIDLDPLGPPWTKTILDPNLQLWPNGGLLNLNETIINVGTEPWFDWHEHILPDFTGVVPAVWVNVQMSVNGNPITFNAVGLNTPNLWLDTFSQPVLPGDILNVRKIIDVLPANAAVPPQPIVIEEYPTPEPASATLIGTGALLLIARRRGAA